MKDKGAAISEEERAAAISICSAGEHPVEAGSGVARAAACRVAIDAGLTKAPERPRSRPPPSSQR